MFTIRALPPIACLLCVSACFHGLPRNSWTIEPIRTTPVPAGWLFTDLTERSEGAPPTSPAPTVLKFLIPYAYEAGFSEVSEFEFERVMHRRPVLRPECGATASLTFVMLRPEIVSVRNGPAVCVSWYDAIAYVNRLSRRQGLEVCYTMSAGSVAWDPRCDGYRLPTELEWEHLAQGTGSLPTGLPTRSLPDGTKLPNLCAMANICDLTAKEQLDLVDAVQCVDGWAGLSPVHSRAPNSIGVFDTIGNAAEWVWTSFYPKADLDRGHVEQTTVLNSDLAMVKGGSWIIGPWDTSSRVQLDRSVRMPHVGFRVVRGAPGRLKFVPNE